MSLPTAVYRLYDEAGCLLYVGISKHPEKRFVEHEQLKFWWDQVASKEITWYPSRAEAEAEEDKATVTEAPRHDRTWRMSGSPARKAGVRRVVEEDPNVCRVVEKLQKAIQEGRFKVGERLPGYRGLAELFDVSLVTAKFAVGALGQAGLVCNLSLSAGYPVTVVRQEPTGRLARRDEFLHLAPRRKR